MQDYYTILEVPPTATQVEIKRSYHRLARLHHPDLNKQALDIHIKRLNEAYQVLGDPQKRAAYDAQRIEAQRQAARYRQQKRASREPEMTWIEGAFGFVNELKKGLKEE
ncbi:MAG TPA: DnaJ domain-containing protein [Ktedonobacteraceae bacterium]|nr:DnaJ domain-containing protein [Ktedonobacteraceae bacterium]